MSSLEDLIRQQRDLDLQIAKLQSASRAAALAEICQIMAAHDLRPGDVVPDGQLKNPNQPVRARPPVPPKYRDEHGRTWTGCGLKPTWLAEELAKGRSLSDFAL